MKTYKEIRTLGFFDMRALCIRQNWCTHMGNEEYGALLERADADNLTTEDIVWLTERICEASDMHPGCYTAEEFFDHVAFEILDACRVVLVREN